MKGKRNTGIDITRIVAFFCVPAVHFFWNSGFYGTALDCNRMYGMLFLRTLFMVCVPLFIIITGYLMSGRDIRLDRQGLVSFYSKLSKVIILYLISQFIVISTLEIHSGQHLTIKKAVLDLLAFEGGYAWYVEMYIGLFLMIPFLNIIWQKCDNKEKRKGVVIVFALLTALPSIVNIFDFSSPDSLLNPWTSDTYNALIPDWWENTYPITYYFIGAYIKKEVDFRNLKSSRLLAALLLTVSAFTAFNIWRNYSVPFIWGKWQSWGGFENVVDATLVFLLINSFNYENVPEGMSKGLGKIGGITFAAYLLSKVPDILLYEKLREAVPEMTMRINYFPVMVPSVIIISLIMAAIVQLIYTVGMKVYGKMFSKN